MSVRSSSMRVPTLVELSAMVLAASAPANADPIHSIPIHSICELLGDPKAFEGITVRVRGVYAMAPSHDDAFFDPECRDRQLALAWPNHSKAEASVHRFLDAVMEAVFDNSPGEPDYWDADFMGVFRQRKDRDVTSQGIKIAGSTYVLEVRTVAGQLRGAPTPGFDLRRL